MRGPDNHGADNHGPGMRGPAPHQDFSSFHRNFNAPHRFHASGYARPNGWYAHHWTFGETLPALFWTRNYWLSDFGDYGLMPPPPGTVWVRDGADALLIDQYSGEIIQVAYNVFY
jgi:Ni/Co efflux regulator RcnB